MATLFEYFVHVISIFILIFGGIGLTFYGVNMILKAINDNDRIRK